MTIDVLEKRAISVFVTIMTVMTVPILLVGFIVYIKLNQSIY